MLAIVCPDGYACYKLLEAGDVLALCGGVALIILTLGFVVWFLTR